ncbi:DUF1565 domain-containing protein [Marinococcus sp. PL1-022]|uniref:DUF1565 domain-containing protein n=1 Tax=Marinococcus sp. PL1-022 TaxID=3095363 RepID=UPI0029C59A82|nr:DUF1565 domain-containing protein [Marinococcus sp. PL1-022]MDX6152275.1 right-handed parallel beta-helix repeat-containing protein [Marinococcus sp. PL1-022]
MPRFYSVIMMLFFLLFISGCGMLPFSADSGESDGGIFVSPSGSDEQNGTIDAPYQSVQQAFDTAEAGDTIYLREGTYRENVKVNQQGEEQLPITIRPFEKENVHLKTAGEKPFFALEDTEYITIKKFTFHQENTASVIVSSGETRALQILDNRFLSSQKKEEEPGSAVHIASSEADSIHEDTVISGNTVERWKYSPAFSLIGNITSFTVSHNRFEKTSGTSLDLQAVPGEVNGRVPSGGNVKNNIINSSSTSSDPGIAVDGAHSIAFSHNTISGGAIGTFIRNTSFAETEDLSFKNNIWRNQTSVGTALVQGPAERPISRVSFSKNTWQNAHGSRDSAQLRIQSSIRHLSVINNDFKGSAFDGFYIDATEDISTYVTLKDNSFPSSAKAEWKWEGRKFRDHFTFQQYIEHDAPASSSEETD